MNKILPYINIFRCILAYFLFYLLHDKNAIKEDLYRLGYSSSLLDFSKAMLRKTSCFRNLFYYRCQREFPRLTRISKIFIKPMFSLEIDVENGIGEAMQIIHGYSTIVFAKRIGEHFTVYQNVTIGRGSSHNGNEIPIIGNNVTCFAGAMILGGVHVGDNATIGAGAIVVKDVPPYTTVVSSPMRFINKKDKESLFNE